MAAERVGANEIYNYSSPGLNLDLMTHLMITDRENIHWGEDSLVLFCATHLERITLHDTDKDLNLAVIHNNELTIKSAPCSRGLRSASVWQAVPEIAKVYDRSWTDHQGLMQLYLIYHWLSLKNTPFIIANMCIEYPRTPGWPTDYLCDWWADQPNAIIFQNTYRDINIGINRPVDYNEYGWGGHHGPEGNLLFFEKSLWPVIEKCYLK